MTSFEEGLVTRYRLPRQVIRSRTDLILLLEFIKAGKVTPVIDRLYPLGEVADAIRYLETGRARGKIIIAL